MERMDMQTVELTEAEAAALRVIAEENDLGIGLKLLARKLWPNSHGWYTTNGRASLRGAAGRVAGRLLAKGLIEAAPMGYRVVKP